MGRNERSEVFGGFLARPGFQGEARACQKVVFAAAILWLCLLDSLVIAVQDAPATAADLVSLAVAYGAYLAAMSLAMFPGWEERPADPTEGGAEGTLDD